MLAHKRVFRNSITVLTASVILRAVNVIAFIYIARQAGPDQSGIFSLCTSYLVLFSSLTWGFDELLTREVAQNRKSAVGYFKYFIKLRLLLSFALYLILLVVTIFILKYPPNILYPILIMAIGLFTDSAGSTVQALLSAFDHFYVFFWANVFNSIVRLLALGFMLFIPIEIITLSWFWTLGSLISAVVLSYSAYRYIKLNDYSKENVIRLNLGKKIRLIGVFLVIGFLGTLEYQIDVIILSAFQNETAISLYGAATTILFSLSLLAQAYRMVIYPVIARYQKCEPEKLGKLCADSYDLLWAVSLPMAVGITLLAPKIVPFVYGSSFRPAISVTQISIWAIIFIFMNVPSSRLLLAGGYHNKMLIILILSTTVNIIMNFWLIPQYSSVGAAVSRLISIILYFSISSSLVSRIIEIQPFALLTKLSKTFLASIVMAIGVYSLRDQSLVVSIPAGIIFYLVSLFIIRKSEILEQPYFSKVLGNRLRRSS